MNWIMSGMPAVLVDEPNESNSAGRLLFAICFEGSLRKETISMLANRKTAAMPIRGRNHTIFELLLIGSSVNLVVSAGRFEKELTWRLPC